MQREHYTIGRGKLLVRGLFMRCPNCGAKGIMRDWFHVRWRCTQCGMLLQRGHGGALGAATWNYGLVVFLFLPIGLCLGWMEWLSWMAVVYFCLGASLVGPVVMYPLSWSLWLMSYYCMLPYELPVNRRNEDDFDEDD